MSANLSTLSVDDEQELENAGILLGPITGTKRKVSAAFLSPESSRSGSSSSSSSASATVSIITPPLSPDTYITLPSSDESIDALEYMGFTQRTAADIFTRFSDRHQAGNRDSLLDYAVSHVAQLRTMSNMSRSEALRRMGLRPEFRDAVLNPRFDDIFGTRGLLFWTQDTLKLRFRSMQLLRRRLRAGAARERRNRTRVRRTPGAAYDPIPGPAGRPAVGGAITATISSGTQFLPAACVEVTQAGQDLPGHRILYNGKAVSEMLDNDFIREDGTVNMNALLSAAGGDFNSLALALYWTPQKDVAEKYRDYAADRATDSETWLIKIQVPQAFIDTLNMHGLYFGNDWKEFVWTCRGMKIIPANLAWLLNGDGIEGHTCHRRTDALTAIPRQDIQRTMTRDDFVMSALNGGARQWVLTNIQQHAEAMGVAIRGKIHIDVFGPRRSPTAR
ncbi:hypothetical protein BDZ85DRAFT_52838 [Elsinoe ampelina]|uniref:Uncharacterized protein n=1 Tax=Elsinoe ampelina TaxID=302913 RepID=A0A6A6GLM1_9PEZI|nr:hypothetical protein BDZ85DRAFT_52838 [Elsinoe ampelina]